MLKGVSFDVGGTLLRRGGPGIAARVASALGIPRGMAESVLQSALHRVPTTPARAAARLCQRLGVSGEGRGRVVAALAERSAVQVCEGAREVLAWCRARGLMIATLSNCASFDAIDVAALLGPFDAVVDSWRFGVCKPERAAFAVVEGALEAGPGELVHVGDDPEADVAGASAAGWRTVLVGPRQARMRADAAVEDLLQLPAVLSVLEGRGLA